MILIGYFRIVKLIPKKDNGGMVIEEYLNEPGIIKKAEFSDDGTKIIINRICPNEYHEPKEINIADYSLELDGNY